MCELEKKMNAALDGVKPTPVTHAIKIMAMDFDIKFKGIDEKLDIILDTVKKNKIDTDTRLDSIIKNESVRCDLHKKQIDKELNKIKFITIFTDNPFLLKIVGISIVVAVLAFLGYGIADTWGLISQLK